MITYSGKAYVHFKFNDPQIGNNTAVIGHLNGLKSIKGTTSTHIALHQAYKLLTDTDNESGADFFFFLPLSFLKFIFLERVTVILEKANCEIIQVYVKE